MQLGFNDNIKHRGILFHLQTEDSGTARPHVITHLYFQGTILASEKLGYAELVNAPDLRDRVRSLMEQQHQAMARRLRAGEFDQIIAQRIGHGALDEVADSKSDTRPGDAPSAPSARPRQSPPQSAPDSARPAGRFGEGVVSDQPLDELILEYLVENARKRKRMPG